MLNANGVVEWMAKNVVPLVLLFIGIAIIASSRQGKLSDNASTLTNIIIGMCVMGGAAVMYAFSGQLVDLVFG
jgi:hypothetical protein